MEANAAYGPASRLIGELPAGAADAFGCTSRKSSRRRAATSAADTPAASAPAAAAATAGHLSGCQTTAPVQQRRRLHRDAAPAQAAAGCAAA